MKYPDMVVLVPVTDLNPENKMYYDEEELPYNPKRPMQNRSKSPIGAQ